jgi:autotransporter-associated beta strand protein
MANTAGAILDLNSFNQTVGALSGGANGGNVTLGSGTLTVNDAGTHTFTGVLSGSGSLIKQGAGTWTLSGQNTYGGTTTVSAGMLAISASNRLPATTALTLSGGTLSLGGYSQTVASLAGSSGTVSLGTNGILTAGDATSTTFSGTISGTSGQLIKQGTGLLDPRRHEQRLHDQHCDQRRLREVQFSQRHPRRHEQHHDQPGRRLGIVGGLHYRLRLAGQQQSLYQLGVTGLPLYAARGQVACFSHLC